MKVVETFIVCRRGSAEGEPLGRLLTQLGLSDSSLIGLESVETFYHFSKLPAVVEIRMNLH